MNQQQTSAKYLYMCKRCGTNHTTTVQVDSVYCTCAWRRIEVVLVQTIAAPDRLSRCASAIMREFRSSSEAYDEISIMHAPSECCGLVAGHERKAIKRILAQYSYTAQQFVDDLTERTSDKYVYFSGFGDLLDMFDLAPWNEHDEQTVAPCDCDSSV